MLLVKNDKHLYEWNNISHYPVKFEKHRKNYKIRWIINYISVNGSYLL